MQQFRSPARNSWVDQEGLGLRVRPLVTCLDSRQDRKSRTGLRLESKSPRLGGDWIDYQVLGERPPDLVMIAAVTVDVAWRTRGVALFLRSLASFS
jgi:hypothetical protein